MKSFDDIIAQFTQHQGQGTNKLLQLISMPAIIFGTFMLLNWINLDFGTVWKISFAWLALIFAAVYYFMLSIYKLATVTTIILIIALMFASWIAGPYPSTFSGVLFLILFIGGWLILLAGKGFNKLGFVKSLGQVLIAPLFLVQALLQVCGLEKKLHTEDPKRNIHNDDDEESSQDDDTLK